MLTTAICRGRGQRRVLLLFLIACLSTSLHWNLTRNGGEDLCVYDKDTESDTGVHLTKAPSYSCGNATRVQTPVADDASVVGCTSDSSEIIYKKDVRLLGRPLDSTRFLTIGIPTVERVYKNMSVSYIEGTLNSLISHMTEEEMKEVLLVIFLADFNPASRHRILHKLETQYKKHIESNLIHVIEAPREFYPRLNGLIRTFNDKPERMFWRSKQSIDYVFLLGYCEGMSRYYMQLEDDVESEPRFIATIKRVIERNKQFKWTFLQFSFWGFIGKFFRNEELPYLGLMLRRFYSDVPCDWNLMHFKKLRGDIGAINAYFGGEQFHHMGHQSSSLGT